MSSFADAFAEGIRNRKDRRYHAKDIAFSDLCMIHKHLDEIEDAGGSIIGLTSTDERIVILFEKKAA